MKRALIVEDFEDTRLWLAGVLAETFPGIAVRAEATLAEGLRAAAGDAFGLALVDLGLPDGSGIELLRFLQRNRPDTMSVVLTVMSDDAMIVSALSAGARGYLLKEQNASQIGRQLVQLIEGMPALSPSVARRLIEHFRRTGPAVDDDGALTPRERETLALIARGHRNREAAACLGVAETTVASHVKSIYRKLGITSRAEASWHATRLGL